MSGDAFGGVYDDIFDCGVMYMTTCLVMYLLTYLLLYLVMYFAKLLMMYLVMRFMIYNVTWPIINSTMMCLMTYMYRRD